MTDETSGGSFPQRLDDSPVGRFLFRDPRAAWLWLAVRVFLGYEWLINGIEKVGAPGWTGAHPGAAVAGFVQGALQKTQGAHPDVPGWYGAFLHAIILPQATAMAYAVTCGEILVGVGLIVGGLTGVAAFFGILMSANYLFSGTLHTNVTMLFPAIFLMLAWRNAGWIGLDRWFLPLLGTPWQPPHAPVVERRRRSAAVTGA